MVFLYCLLGATNYFFLDDKSFSGNIISKKLKFCWWITFSKCVTRVYEMFLKKDSLYLFQDLSYQEKSYANFINSLGYKSSLRKNDFSTIQCQKSIHQSETGISMNYIAHVNINYTIHLNVSWEVGWRVNFSAHSPCKPRAPHSPTWNMGTGNCNSHL